MLNIVCVNAGNYLGRGADYVNILADMVGRNISKETAYKFVCFTDDADFKKYSGSEELKLYDSEIDLRPLPVDGLKGWWNKLALFKKGIFPDGDMILYLDLDTVITSGLDDIIKYDGEFAILRDFYRPDGLQSSVMAWEANRHTHIWREWLRHGCPRTDGGDQAWIETRMSNPDIWQDLFPDFFVSYKVHAAREISKNARMVIFHGNPRPHEIKGGWMPHVWKVGGGTTLELKHVCNTDEDTIAGNIRNALKLPFPWLNMLDAHDRHAVIVGGAPSLKNDIAEIHERQRQGQFIFSTNGTYNYLIENDILPDAHVMMDAREENKEFIRPISDSVHYYASQCHLAVFEKAKNLDVVLWHPMIDGVLGVIGENTGDPLVGGGTSVGLKSIALAWILGYRSFHIYGMDSSYTGGENHAYKQPLNDGERVIEVVMNGKKYQAAPWMATQVENFKELVKALVEGGCTMTVHGEGLLPD